MPGTSKRPARRPTPRRGSRRPPPTDSVNAVIAAVVSAALVVIIGIAVALILTLVTWALAPHSDSVGPDDSARLAVGMWLFTHHVPLQIGETTIGIVPLGLMLIPGLLAYAGGRQIARVVRPRTLTDVTRAVVPYALVYGLLAAIAAGVVRSDAVQPAPRTAFFAATLIALVAGALALLRASGQLGEAVHKLPDVVRDVAASATAGLASVMVVSAVLTAVALAVGFPDAVDMYRALDAGWSGGLALILLTVAFVPNLVLWTASFTTGVGFTVGPEGVVSPQGIEYGALPVFPPFAALPPEGEAGGLSFIALVAPLLGGYAIAAVMHRRRPTMQVEPLAARATGAGVAAGFALGALAWLSAGPAGDAGLSSLGPVGWQVGLVAALEMSLVAAVVAWELHRRGGTHPLRPRLIDLRDRVTSGWERRK